MSSFFFFFPSLQYIYVIYLLPICINLRHNILKILVKNFLYKKYIPQVGAKINILVDTPTAKVLGHCERCLMSVFSLLAF